jgi:periplasmic protein TonB
MIRLGEEKSDHKKWAGLLVLSFFLHASIIGALVLVPEQAIKKFTSAMDFTVVKSEPKPPKKVEPPKEKPKPEPRKEPKKAVKPEEKKEIPPPPEIKKFEMSKDSFTTGEGTWGLKADIGDSRVGSFTGTPDGGIKKLGTGTKSEAQAPPKPPKPKKVVVKDKPKVLEEVTIPYPPEARKLEIQGDVKLEVTIDEKGTVTRVTILEDPGGGLGEAAAKALKKFRFSPAVTDEGKPVSYTIKYLYSFVLD